MDAVLFSTCEEFEGFCLRSFESYMSGDLFPYSLRETYRLAFDTWEEAELELKVHGVDGFTYYKLPDGSDYQMCMQGFTQHVLMHERSLELLSQFCNTTYKILMNMFDVPLRYETRCEVGEDGRMRLVPAPVGGYGPKAFDLRRNGIEEANGDIAAKVQFDRFLQKNGYTWRTADISEAFDMPEEGLVCILKQNGIEPKEAWTYQDYYFVYLLLTKDCKVRPRCEKQMSTKA